jgi:hypothetical protein
MTITFEQAKKLHELGVRKHSEKAWWYHEHIDHPIVDISGRMGYGKIEPVAHAYSAEELLAMMSHGDLEIVRSENATYYTFCLMKDVDGVEYWGQVNGATLTEALGNKVIHDLENNIITIEEINK